MGLTTAAKNDLLLLMFNNTNWANNGDATGLRGSTTAGNYYLALHTADPTIGGNQSSSETGYTSYVRIAAARSGAGWTVASGQLTNAAAVNFVTPTGGSGTITHISIGQQISGANEIIVYGALSSPQTIAVGVPITFAIGSIILTLTP